MEDELIKTNPVIDSDGNKRWFKTGTNIIHRIDGPAVEYADGMKYWHLNGEHLAAFYPHTNGRHAYYQYIRDDIPHKVSSIKEIEQLFRIVAFI